MLCLQQCICMSPATPDLRVAKLNDIIKISKSVPQKKQGKVRWAYSGGAAAALFFKEFGVRTLNGSERRLRAPVENGERDCKDLDVVVFQKFNPFEPRADVRGMYFKRHVILGDVALELMRGNYFYNPAPSTNDLVIVNANDNKIICVSPEYLCATHIKAVIEGRRSSISDVFRIVNAFEDFDFETFQKHIDSASIGQLFDRDELSGFISGIRRSRSVDEMDAHVSELAPSLIERYYREKTNITFSVSFGVRKLANGIGIINMNDLENRDKSDPHFCYNLIWDIQRKMIDAIYNRERNEISDHGLLETFWIARIMKSLSDLIVIAHEALPNLFLANFFERLSGKVIELEFGDYLHPLASTYIGLFDEAARKISAAPGKTEYYLKGWLQRRLKCLIADASEDSTSEVE